MPLALSAGLLASGLLVARAAVPPPLLVWNASASMPIGLYAVTPGGAPVRGAVVIAWLPAADRAFAARRGYLPAQVPLVKRVASKPGDRICADGERVWVNGLLVALRRARDGTGRSLPWWSGCARPATGLLLLGEGPASYDGRYFGPLPGRTIVGTARRVWPR